MIETFGDFLICDIFLVVFVFRQLREEEKKLTLPLTLKMFLRDKLIYL